MNEKIGDWKLRWVIGGVLLSLVAYLGQAYLQQIQTIAVQAQTIAGELDKKVSGLEDVKTTADELAKEVAEIKTKTAVVETNNKDIIRRLDIIDAGMDRLEAKVDYLISKTK